MLKLSAAPHAKSRSGQAFQLDRKEGQNPDDTPANNVAEVQQYTQETENELVFDVDGCTASVATATQSDQIKFPSERTERSHLKPVVRTPTPLGRTRYRSSSTSADPGQSLRLDWACCIHVP